MTDKRRNDKRYQIVKKTKENMQNLGVYRKQFDPTIRRYANLRLMYDDLNRIVEKKLKKSNEIVDKEFKQLENLQKLLIDCENTLGLTPKGLKSLQAKSMEQPKKSLLAEVLSGGI